MPKIYINVSFGGLANSLAKIIGWLINCLVMSMLVARSLSGANWPKFDTMKRLALSSPNAGMKMFVTTPTHVIPITMRAMPSALF